MRSLAAAFLLLLFFAVAACGGAEEGKSPINKDVDVAAWKGELVQLDGVGSDPDMVALERITRSDCVTPVDDLALRFSLEGANPEATRLGMEYVCPDRAANVDKALAQGRDAASSVDDACALTEAERTEDEQALVELAGRDC
jgi:hypothetical protein